jgi:hypothetical protein
MQVERVRCCGLDIHKKTVVACVLLLESNGQRQKEIRTFQTVLAELVTLKAWLEASRLYARGDGINRGVLEAHLEWTGRPL